MITTRLRFLAVKGYEIRDFKEYLSKGHIDVHMDRMEGEGWRCSRCSETLGAQRGHYRIKVEGEIKISVDNFFRPSFFHPFF